MTDYRDDVFRQLESENANLRYQLAEARWDRHEQRGRLRVTLLKLYDYVISPRAREEVERALLSMDDDLTASDLRADNKTQEDQFE